MKAVLISIQPTWCELIASGKKTMEVRKNFPNLKPPFKVYIYETLGKKRYYSQPDPIPYYEGKGKVIGEFVCDCYDAYWFTEKDTDIEEYEDVQLSCVPVKELLDYANGQDLYFWNISDLVIYDEPKPFGMFHKCGAVPCGDMDEELCNYCGPTDYGDKRSYSSQNGAHMCEGRWCSEAYQEYLDDNFALTRPPQSWCYVEG